MTLRRLHYALSRRKVCKFSKVAYTSCCPHRGERRSNHPSGNLLLLLSAVQCHSFGRAGEHSIWCRVIRVGKLTSERAGCGRSSVSQTLTVRKSSATVQCRQRVCLKQARLLRKGESFSRVTVFHQAWHSELWVTWRNGMRTFEGHIP